MPSGINLAFARLSRSDWQVGYVLLTRAPVAIRIPLPEPYAAPRLACVKPVASVHPEPGSNSSLYISISFVPYARNRSYLLIDVGFIPSKQSLFTKTVRLLYYLSVLHHFKLLGSSSGGFPYRKRMQR